MSFPPNLGITSSFIIDSGSSLVFQEFPSLLPPLEKICSPFSTTRMNGYSRIRKASTTTRSKSVDFSDLSFPHHTPSFCTNSKFKSREPEAYHEKALKIHNPIPENEQEEEDAGEVFGVILGRKHSVSSDQKVVAEQESSSSFQTAAKRSFSIRRSASVSEGYSRIHHRPDLTVAEDDDQCGTVSTSQNRYMKKKGKFLKACRRLFGL
ncbi:hypothetical protein Salat_2744600 [Sesamum alatum]|uniref:Uncharacterized protein n=1 Tax=Sesamum alatum TaxID=300844 RepID=A0AAE1XJX3_9LAMI|nr:hypothetical protein Salat_2744600 [Sesamum alatum]